MTRKNWLPVFIVSGVSFVLFEVVLDYLAYQFKLPHRSWVPGIALGLAGTVLLVARRWLSPG